MPRRWTRLLAARPDIDAVFAASDLMAAGATVRPRSRRPARPRGRRDRRLRRLARRHLHPAASLTSVRQPIEEMGHEMARLLIELVEGTDRVPTARDPGHRTRRTRLERREAHALSRPATGGPTSRSAPNPIRPHIEVEIEPDLAAEESNRDEPITIQPAPRSPLLGVVAILAAACGGTTTSSTASSAARRQRRRPPPAAAPPSRPRSSRRRRSPPAPAPTAASSSAGSSASAPAPSPRRSARSRRSSTPTTRRRRTSTSSTRSSTTPRQRRSSRREIAAGNAPDIIGPVGVEGLNLFADQLLDLKPLIASTGYEPTGVDPALVDFFNCSARTAPPSACRSRSTRRSSSTTRTSSTRPTCRCRRPRSATCTRASRGTWTRSAPWP